MKQGAKPPQRETPAAAGAARPGDAPPRRATPAPSGTIRSAVANARLASILEMIGDAFVAFDRDFNYSYVNERAAALFGRDAFDLLGRNYWEEFPEARGTPFAEAYLRALATGETIQFESHFEPWDRWFENRIYPSADGLAIFFTEITDRKRAEAAMQQERDLSNALLDSLPGIFYICDDRPRLVRWNRNFEKVTGYSAEELATIDPLLLVVPAERESIGARLARAFTDGVDEGEGRLVAKDGTVTPFYLTGVRTQIDGRQCLVGVGIDVSQRRAAEAERARAEAAIAESERRLALIFDTVSDVVFLVTVEPDETFRFASVNSAFLEVTGLSAAQVVGKRVEEVLPPSSRELVLGRYREAIRTCSPVHWEEVSVYPSGTLYGEVTVTPAIDASGRCTHLIGSVHDVTETRRAAEEVRRLNQQLERRVAERTAQLEAANKELEAFSYSVSHDLRAPLRAVSGFAEIIARRHRASLPPEGQRYFDNIVQASERMSQLIDALLTHSRLGHRAVRRDAVPLGDVLGPLAAAFAPRVQAAGGRLTIARDLPPVIGDRVLLEQVFSNLLDNALTYHQPGTPPEVDVSWAREEDCVIVSVRDRGIGIPSEHHEKIFSIFQRLHSDDAYPGTGVGLATVRKALDMLGGYARVESRPGEGAVFHVALPAAPAAAAEAP